MSDIKILRLENMPLKSIDGTVRSKRCNILSFHCPVCDMWHTQERKNTYIIQTEDETLMICKEAYEFWSR